MAQSSRKRAPAQSTASSSAAARQDGKKSGKAPARRTGKSTGRVTRRTVSSTRGTGTRRAGGGGAGSGTRGGGKGGAKGGSTGGGGGARSVRSSPAPAAAKLADTVALGHLGRLLREVAAIACAFAGIIVLLALVTFDVDDPGWSRTGGHDGVVNSVGQAGAWFADLVFYVLGYMAYLVPAILVASACLLFTSGAREARRPRAYRPFVFVRVIGIALMLVSASGLADLHFGVADGALPRGTFGGGILGTAVAWHLVAYLHTQGTTLLLLASFLCSLTLAFGTSWLQLVESIGALLMRGVDWIGARFDGRSEARAENARRREEEAERLDRHARSEPAATAALDGGNAGIEIDARGRPQASRGAGGRSFGEHLRGVAGVLRRVFDGPDLPYHAGAGGGRADPFAESMHADDALLAGAGTGATPGGRIRPRQDAAGAGAGGKDGGRTGGAGRKARTPASKDSAGAAGDDPFDIAFDEAGTEDERPAPKQRGASASKPKSKPAPKQATTPKRDAAADSVADSADAAPAETRIEPRADARTGDEPVPVTFSSGRSVMDPDDDGLDATLATGPAGAPAGAYSDDGVDPAVAAAAEVARRKIAIKPRVVSDERQSSLYLNVPDTDLPPLSLLDAPEPQSAGFSAQELEGLSTLLEQKLAEFRIEVEVVAVQPGPVITRFEMELAPGIKASRVTGLAQDLARSLSLVSVRVVEVIAGKSTIGIEVPNEKREIVQLSELLMSEQFQKQQSPLTLALGKDISGQSVTADLGRMPHLLVAGTTGSGKSVGVNSMLISLLYKATAKEVRLILIDPKMLELNVYEGIPHLLTPVVTDMKEAANALRWCVGEMERRYALMAACKVRNIAGYNRKVKDAFDKGEPMPDPTWVAELSLNPSGPPPTLEPMPVIVVVIDEFADMMMQVGKKAEELISRIAAKARAAGIHLILATQRPSVDVITGLIKANVPTRIAFQVSTKIDSRTIIDQGGAESLLGHGDMLFQPPGASMTQRVHGAFVDDHEVQNVVGWIKQTGEPAYIEEILQESNAAIPGLSGGDEGGEGGESDPLYDQAVQVVAESRRASISFVQRKLKIGYNRSARMIEDMETAGVVSPDMNGKREVLVPPPR